MKKVEDLKNSSFRRAIMACQTVQQIKALGGDTPIEGFVNSVSTFVLQLGPPVKALEDESGRLAQKLAYEKSG